MDDNLAEWIAHSPDDFAQCVREALAPTMDELICLISVIGESIQESVRQWAPREPIGRRKMRRHAQWLESRRND